MSIVPINNIMTQGNVISIVGKELLVFPIFFKQVFSLRLKLKKSIVGQSNDFNEFEKYDFALQILGNLDI